MGALWRVYATSDIARSSGHRGKQGQGGPILKVTGTPASGAADRSPGRPV